MDLTSWSTAGFNARTQLLTDPNSHLPESGGTGKLAGRIDFSLARKILLLTLPVTLGRQLENIIEMVNLFMIGKLGAEAISAYGISRTVTMVTSVSMMAVTTGTFSLVAQAIGAGSFKNASATAKQALGLLLLSSIVISPSGVLAAPYMLPALSVGPEVVQMGTPFLQVFYLGMPFMTLNYAITTCLHGAGDTRTPFYIGLLNNSVKLSISYLLIFGVFGLPRLGVTGAAVGDIVGRGVGVIVGFWVLYSGRFGLTLLPETSYRPNWNLARRILKIGVPAAFQGFVRNGSSLVYVKLIALTKLSTPALAAFSIGRQIERVLRHTSLSFGTAATTLVGQSLGQKNPDQAERWGWTTMATAMVVVVTLSVPAVLFAPQIIGVFTDVPDVIGIGVIYLFAIVLSEPFMCVGYTSAGGLQGAGETLPPFYYTVVSQWFVRLPIAYLLAFTFGYDINGIWGALIVFSITQGLLNLRKFAKGDWKVKKI